MGLLCCALGCEGAGVVGGCAGRAPSVACLSRVRGHGRVAAGISIGAVTGRCAAVVCMFEDVFWHIALTLLQFVFILSNMY